MDETDDVERGYYVYLHRDRIARTPFYVGKGKGRRAHDMEGRHPEWQKKVKSLEGGLDVEIVRSDLTEEEAYDLERELIREYGKVSDGTGTLLNITDGGSLDFGEASVELEIALPASIADAIRADYEDRTYRKLPPEERTLLAQSLKAKMQELRVRYENAVGDDEETDFELLVDGVLWETWNLAEKYANRKVSSKDFGYELECLSDDAESYLEDAGGENPMMVGILQECRAFVKEKVKHLKESGQFHTDR